MYTLSTLHLNKKEDHNIPRPSDLYARFGFSNKKGSYTGDETIAVNESKLDTLDLVQKEIAKNDK